MIHISKPTPMSYHQELLRDIHKRLDDLEEVGEPLLLGLCLGNYRPN